MNGLKGLEYTLPNGQAEARTEDWHRQSQREVLPVQENGSR